MDKKIYHSSTINHNNVACLALGCFSKIGPRRFLAAKNYFKDISKVMSVAETELMLAGWPASLAGEFVNFREGFDSDAILKRLADDDAGFVTIEDPIYPDCLREIFDPPFIIFYRGDLDCFKSLSFSIAVVGSRKASLYGQRAVELLISPLAGKGMTIISGLASGIDAEAHESALSKRTRSIGVIGSGIAWNDFYPRINLDLARRLERERGLIVSEFFMGTPPFKANFPRRNRLIAALAPALLVIEAGSRSGALITARHMLDLGKEVLTVPGSIFSDNFRGCHYLLKNGAALVESADDVLEVLENNFNWVSIPKKTSLIKMIDNNNDASLDSLSATISPAEAKIFSALKDFPLSVEEIVLNTGLDIRMINSTLSIMEIKGSVRKNNISQYFLK